MIDLLPSDDQQQILDAARTLLSERFSPDRLRGHDGADPAADAGWSELVDFGWFMIGLPEAVGGAGLGLAEETLLFREAGRFLLPPSVLATSLAAHLAAEAGNEALAGELATGAARAGLGFPSEDGAYLVDADRSAYVLMLDETGLHLFARDAFADIRPAPSLDEAVRLERAAAPSAPPVLENSARGLSRHAEVLISAMLIGLAEASLELATDYAKIREQFGQPIGSFQAVKHRCADMCVRAETAGAQVAMAALSYQDDQPDAEFQVLAAARSALQAARENGASCIQVHGGMGFTAECHAHRFLKRHHILAQLLGGPRRLEARLLAAAAPE